jgi:hypothetical protein
MRRVALWVGVIGLVATGGCARTTLKASITQPNPLVVASAKASYPSQRVFIETRDMELPDRVTLRQSAYFNVVSRERLRFRVMLVHKWKEIADITTWNVRLEDDRGNVFYPESKERSYNDLITKVWDHELRTAVRNEFGDIQALRNDGYKRRMVLESFDVFQGAGDYVFHAKNLFGRGVQRLTLIMQRSGVEYRFSWKFVELKGDEGDVAEGIESHSL